MSCAGEAVIEVPERAASATSGGAYASEQRARTASPAPQAALVMPLRAAKHDLRARRPYLARLDFCLVLHIHIPCCGMHMMERSCACTFRSAMSAGQLRSAPARATMPRSRSLHCVL
jgi:hypothetical protein